MAVRPAKVGGGGATTYTQAVANGAINILAADVDNDFTEIYTNINNTNIAAGAGITYNKLNLTNSIVGSDLTALSVTNAKIAGGAPVSSLTTVGVTSGGPISNVVGTIVTLGAFTPRSGARVVLLATIGTSYNNGSGVSQTITFSLEKDAVALQALSFTVDAEAFVHPIPIGWTYVDTPTNASHTYRVRVVTSSASTSVIWTTSGNLTALEF
jgi:hypothetical protein